MTFAKILLFVAMIFLGIALCGAILDSQWSKATFHLLLICFDYEICNKWKDGGES